MATVSNTRKWFDTSEYPEPAVIFPDLQHKQTTIILHGRGSSAEKFGTALLQAEIPEFARLILRRPFPHAKFIFPTASKRRATIYKRTYTNQWFDNWHLSSLIERKELQIEGLRESSAFIHSLLRREIELVGAKNVVLGRLSQGCAASLVGLFTWDREPLATAVGMCGWLPYRRQMEDIVRNIRGDDSDDPFERPENTEIGFSLENKFTGPSYDLPTQAISFLCEELEIALPNGPLAFQSIPIFLGHGT